MITSTVTLCALPEQLWYEKTIWGKQTFAIHSFVEDALGIEFRIQKGVNQENERARLNLCCARLEATIKLSALQEIKSPSEFQVVLSSNQLPAITLGHNYLDAIRLMYQQADVKSSAMRLGATFFPPKLVEPHINAFASLAGELELSQLSDLKLRIAFFQFAAKYHCGIVEIQNPFIYQEQTTKLSIELNKIDSPKLQIQNEDEEVFENEGRNAYEILSDQVYNAIQNAKEGKPCAVNFSNQPHNIITEVLNEFAYSDSGKLEKPIYIRVIYTDGSQAKDLPLQCLPNHHDDELVKLTKTLPLKAALLSMRHLEMDDKVDISWFRNREVSKARAFAETDQFCYEETKNQLAGTRKDSVFILHLYQTGLQPAVIGFYRALIEELMFREKLPPSLAVTPFYHSKSGYKQGKVWY